jgi:hypothetical protein
VAARRLLGLKEVAGYLHVPVAKLAPYLRFQGNKRLPARKVRGRWVIDLEEFHDWLVNLYEEARDTPTGSSPKGPVIREPARRPLARRKRG